MSSKNGRRRVSRGALTVAAREGDIATLFHDCEPVLLGWSEDDEEVWEITLHFSDAPDNTLIATDRFPLQHSTLMNLAINGFDGTRFVEGLAPRLAKRAETFNDRAPEGVDWQLMTECPTYLPADAADGSTADGDNPDYRRWVPGAEASS